MPKVASTTPLGEQFLSNWAESNPNLPMDPATWHIFILISPSFQVSMSMSTQLLSEKSLIWIKAAFSHRALLCNLSSLSYQKPHLPPPKHMSVHWNRPTNNGRVKLSVEPWMLTYRTKSQNVSMHQLNQHRTGSGAYCHMVLLLARTAGFSQSVSII